MSISISPLNKGNIVTYRNNTCNGDSNRDSGGDNGGDSDSINKGFNKSYSTKITCIQDDPGTLVNHRITTAYISNLRPDYQLIPTSLYVKEVVPDLRLDVATCIEFI